uniref:Uncharacterized protein n=1 Tax=Conchiformibius kuhniae TaxID=211502 RepID=A0A8T9MTN3_9NEIS|nr:hypothetical protein LVJ77_09165 [Conchiformibius kuhniae]
MSAAVGVGLAHTRPRGRFSSNSAKAAMSARSAKMRTLSAAGSAFSKCTLYHSSVHPLADTGARAGGGRSSHTAHAVADTSHSSRVLPRPAHAATSNIRA